MTVSPVRVRVAQTDELGRDAMSELTALCEAAFRLPFAPVWDRVGPGIHVIVEADGRAAAHAMIVDRRVFLGHEADLALDVGYVENVATLPELQGRGHGARAMGEIGRIIREEYVLGALATTSQGFYLGLGWEAWQGPTSVRMPDGERVRSLKQDGNILFLRTPRSPADLDPRGPIAVDWRAGEPW
jgi:aminoglycoside 2'-N-acetyltransferase I